MRTPLFRYFGEEAYALTFIDTGEVYLRPLAYFRAFEDEQVRGDLDEAMLLHAPETGLVLTKENGGIVALPEGWRFRASAKENDLFVYCLSPGCASLNERQLTYAAPPKADGPPT